MIDRKSCSKASTAYYLTKILAEAPGKALDSPESVFSSITAKIYILGAVSLLTKVNYINAKIVRENLGITMAGAAFTD